MTETVGMRIKALRKEKNISQVFLADSIGVNHSTLSRWEQDATVPTTDNILSLSSVLGVAPSVLAFGDDDIALDDSTRTAYCAVPDIHVHDNPVVAFQGEIGAYSHLATHTLYPNVNLLPCLTFVDAFKAVENGQATFAVIPIENSLGGRVADIHHLLPESCLHIVGEYLHRIEHCLLGVRGSRLADITHVYSHEQALSQCRHRLRDMGSESMKYSDTAGAAKFISEDKDLHKGALASSLAGEIYNLETLHYNMEDDSNNFTRFVVLSRNVEKISPQAQKYVTSCLFSTCDIPASLYKALGGFATNGVQILKLESYVPIHNTMTQNASFYVEFLGHTKDIHIIQAMEELAFYTTKISILGTYVYNR